MNTITRYKWSVPIFIATRSCYNNNMSTYPSTSPEFRLEVQPASAPVPPILEVSPNAEDSPPLRYVRTAGSGREKTTSRHLHASGSILLGALVGGAVWGLVLHQCY